MKMMLEVRVAPPPLLPYSSVLVGPDDCSPEKAFVDALKDAVQLMKSDRAASLDALSRSFDKMDPALVKDAFDIFAPLAQPDLRITDEMFRNAINFDIMGGIFAKHAKLPPLAELYCAEFAR
jgi:hypothetical protein